MGVVAVRKRPGLYFNTDTKKYFSIVEYYDGEKYDTVAQASGAISSGAILNLFRDLANKDKNDSNFDTARRISKGEEMLVKRIGSECQSAFGNTLTVPADARKVLWGAYLNVKINKIEVAEGPLVMFPSGYGVYGSTTENNTGVVSNGIPSTASQRPLEKIHEITSEHDISGTVTFFDHSWDAANMPTLAGKVHIRVSLGGLIRRAATK